MRKGGREGGREGGRKGGRKKEGDSEGEREGSREGGKGDRGRKQSYSCIYKLNGICCLCINIMLT